MRGGEGRGGGEEGEERGGVREDNLLMNPMNMTSMRPVCDLNFLDKVSLFPVSSVMAAKKFHPTRCRLKHRYYNIYV